MQPRPSFVFPSLTISWPITDWQLGAHQREVQLGEFRFEMDQAAQLRDIIGENKRIERNHLALVDV